jgi:hypothetical protein
VRLLASVRWADGSAGRAEVSDLSYLGCRLYCDRRFTKGETVRLTLPERGELFAQVRWVRGSRAGVRFITGQSNKDTRRARIGV